MIIDLIGGSYEHKFKDWNSQRTVNWYPKITDQKGQEKNKTQIALFPRPGLVQYVDMGGNSVRGLFVARTLTQERCFAVVGTNLYEIKYDLSSTLLGPLVGFASGSRSKVYMAVNNNSELLIQDTQAAYSFDMTTNTLTKVSDVDYPGGTTLDYSDGYFIISDKNGRVTFSELGSSLSWDSLNFFTPSYKPDKVKAIVAYREEVYCFGDETIEIYINDGTTPFIRQSRTSIFCGLTARDSIAVHQSGVFFLGRSSIGGSEVYLMGSNYSLTPISSPAISNRLNNYVNDDAEGFISSTSDGHIFYHLHLPSLQTSLVYDVTTGMWHERQSERPYPDSDGSKVQDMYRGRNHVMFKGKHLYGDWWSGKIFKEEGSTDDGNIRVLKRTSSIFQNEQKYISVYKLEFDVNSGNGATTTGQGSNPVMLAKYSMDGGNTFEPGEVLTLGTLGNYDNRVQTNNLGTSRNWVISFTITDPIDVIIMQAIAKGSFGAF